MSKDDSALAFVYGNMRRHGGLHRLLAGCELAAAQCRTAGRLYDSGDGYPVMAPGGKGWVYGELYRATPEVLRRLDIWEGCSAENRIPQGARVRQAVHTDRGEKQAYVYLHPGTANGGRRAIESGDWAFAGRSGEARAGKPLLYFAYGSCMDDERFKRANKDIFFKEVLGGAALQGYSLRFTRRARDGGRADMLEIGGHVEGKLYRIGQEALDYLEVREGVRSGSYRPALVDVRAGKRTYKGALTFLVKEKSAGETAPPKHYADEIRRGGSSVWTAEYERGFELHLQRLSEGSGSDGEGEG